MLLRRALDGVQTEPIAGTERGIAPFFSPDGQWIGFFTVDELKKVPLAGGTAVLLSKVPPITCGGELGGGRPNRSGSDVQRRARHRPRDRRRVAPPDAARLLPWGTRASLSPVSPRRARSSLHGAAGEGFRRHAGVEHRRPRLREGNVEDRARRRELRPLRRRTARLRPRRLACFRPASTSPRLAVTGTAVAISESVAVDPARGFGNFDISPAGTLVYPRRPAESRGESDGGPRSGPERKGERDSAAAGRVPDGGALAGRRASRRDSLGGNPGLDRHLRTRPPHPVDADARAGLATSARSGRPTAAESPSRRFAETCPALSVKNADGSGEIEALTDPIRGRRVPELLVSGRQGHPLHRGLYGGSRPEAQARLERPLDRLARRPEVRAPVVRDSVSRDGRGVLARRPLGRVCVRRVGGPGGLRAALSGPGRRNQDLRGLGIEPLWSRDGRTLYYRSGDEREVHGRRDPELFRRSSSPRPGSSSPPSSTPAAARTTTATTTFPRTARSSSACARFGRRRRNDGSRS